MHDVVVDGCGWNEARTRYTCYSCGATLIRHPWMDDDDWADAKQEWTRLHPHDKPMTWNEYKQKQSAKP